MENGDVWRDKPREGVWGGGMMGNEKHYEQVTVKRQGKRRMEGQVKEVFRARMSRQPYDDVTECAPKLSVCLSVSRNVTGTLRTARTSNAATV